MKLNIVLVVFLLFLTPLVSFGANSNISKISFTNDAVTVLPNEISAVLTIQTQNSSGESENLSSTADATFKSSSPTGKFYSSSGVEDPDGVMTMSSGSANKNFKYSDSAEGTYTITATVKVRDGSGEWTTSQSIIVGNGGNTENTDTGSNTDNTDTTDNSDNGNTKGLSKV